MSPARLAGLTAGAAGLGGAAVETEAAGTAAELDAAQPQGEVELGVTLSFIAQFISV